MAWTPPPDSNVEAFTLHVIVPGGTLWGVISLRRGLDVISGRHWRAGWCSLHHVRGQTGVPLQTRRRPSLDIKWASTYLIPRLPSLQNREKQMFIFKPPNPRYFVLAVRTKTKSDTEKPNMQEKIPQGPTTPNTYSLIPHCVCCWALNKTSFQGHPYMPCIQPRATASVM